MAASEQSQRPRKAVGPARPAYLDTTDVDRVMATLLALTSEVAALRERLDTHERLAQAGSLPSPDGVEAYVPDSTAEAARELWRDGYIRRLFRVFTEDLEFLKSQGPSGD